MGGGEGSRITQLDSVSQAPPVGLQISGLPDKNPRPFLSPQPPASFQSYSAYFLLLTGPTVTTLGSYELSEGCERKKGQRWGSLERRGMQAMEGEFSVEKKKKKKSFSIFHHPTPQFPSILLPSLTPEL